MIFLPPPNQFDSDSSVDSFEISTNGNFFAAKLIVAKHVKFDFSSTDE